jgi:hypothetical protein
MIRMLPHYPTMSANYCTNAGAEPVVNLNVWAAYTGCTRAVDTVERFSGLQSMRYTTNSTASMGAIYLQQRIIDRGNWLLSAWAKGPAGLGLRVEGRLVRANLAYVTQGLGFKETFMTGGWQNIDSLPFTVNASQAPVVVCLQIRTGPTAVGTVFWLDDVRIRQIP